MERWTGTPEGTWNVLRTFEETHAISAMANSTSRPSSTPDVRQKDRSQEWFHSVKSFCFVIFRPQSLLDILESRVMKRMSINHCEMWDIALRNGTLDRNAGRNVKRSADVSGNARHFCDGELDFTRMWARTRLGRKTEAKTTNPTRNAGRFFIRKSNKFSPLK